MLIFVVKTCTLDWLQENKNQYKFIANEDRLLFNEEKKELIKEKDLLEEKNNEILEELDNENFKLEELKSKIDKIEELQRRKEFKINLTL